MKYFVAIDMCVMFCCGGAWACYFLSLIHDMKMKEFNKEVNEASEAYAGAVFTIPSILFMILMAVSIVIMMMFKKHLEPVAAQFGPNKFYNGNHAVSYMYNSLILGVFFGTGLSTLVHTFYGILKDDDDVDVLFYEFKYACPVFLIPLTVFGTIALVMDRFIQHLDRKWGTSVPIEVEENKKPLLGPERRV